MTTAFNGRDLVTHFKEDPANQAIRQYRAEYQGLTNTITHYIDMLKSDGVDGEGNRTYTDILTYAENEAAGLTRTPTATYYSQDADLRWSQGLTIYLQNPIPVFGQAPNIISTVTGIQVEVIAPSDRDLAGYIAWVGSTPDFALDSTTERYRGASTSFSIPLPDLNAHYVRVAPYDSFGVDTASAWSAQVAQRAVSSVAPANELSNSLQSKVDADIINNMLADLANDSYSRTVNVVWQDNFTLEQSKREELKLTLDGVSADLVTEQTVRLSADQALATRMDTLESTAGGANALVQTEATARANADNALGTRIDTLTTTVGDNKTTVTNSITSLTTTQGAQGTAITNLTTDYNTNKTSVSSSLTALSNADSALGTRIDNLTTTVGNNKSSFDSQISTLTTNTSANATAITNLGTRFNSFNGVSGQTIETTINNVNSAISSGDGANATAINSVKTRLDNVTANGSTLTIEAQVQNAFTAVSNETGARATAIQNLSTSLGGQIGGIQTTLSSTISDLGVVQNSFGVKLNNNGQAVGFGINSSSAAGTSFVIVSDNFQIVKPGGGARLEWANNAIKVYDTSGVLRVQIGDLSQ